MSTSGPALGCPHCGASLSGGVLAGICPVCAWRELGAEAEDGVAPGALFAVPGHDVIGEIARGGGGIVYRAVQREPRREVALKLMPPALLGWPELQARFRMEAETVATLDHPAILPVYQVGEHEGLPFFTMKLATGGTLTARRDALAGRWREIAALVITLAEAVHHAHTHGVVHRDLKPGNVLFDEAGRAYVSDFGLAKFTTAEPSVTRSLVVMGTPAYLAPEVVAGGAAVATTGSDLYGLGAILYELLAGQPPFVSDSIPELLRQVTGDAPVRPSLRRPGVPRDLEVICLRCLEKDPARRLTGAAALAEDLQRWLDDRPVLARPVGAGERAVRWARRNPALATLSGVLVLALVAGGVALEASRARLRRALAKAETAEATAEDRLHGALLDQARLIRTSGQRGQRHEALEVLARAAAIKPSAAVRNETIAALARPDLKFERALPAYFANEAASIAVAPDFKTYLSASGKGDFVRLDLATGSVVRCYQPVGGGQAVEFSFSGDGRWFTAKLGDGRLEVWASEGEKPAWVFSPRGRLSVAHALHPSASLCAWGDETGAIQVRELMKGEIRPLTERGTRVVRLQFSPDGARLALMRSDRLEMVETATGKTIWTREGRGETADVAWSADGRWVATVVQGRGDVTICAADKGGVVQVLPGGGELPQFVAFHPGNRRLATISRDGTFRLWDIVSGEGVFQTGVPPRVLAFSPDGRQMVAARRWLEVGLFSWADETVFREFQGSHLTREAGDDLSASPDGRWLATADTREVRVWDTARGAQVAAVPFAAGADWTSARFRPDGSALVYSAMNRGVFSRSVTTAPNPTTGVVELKLGEEQPVGANRNGRLIAFGAGRRDWYVDREAIAKLVVWPEGDPTRERVIAESRKYDRPAISAEGKYVVTMGYPMAKIRVTAVDAGKPETVLPITLHAGAGFSPDGRWLATGTDATYQLWSLPDLRPGPQWPRAPEGTRWSTPVFSPDGKWASFDRARGELELRDVPAFREQAVLTPPLRIGQPVVAWTAGGDRLYVLGQGHRLFEWNLTELRRELTARGLGW